MMRPTPDMDPQRMPAYVRRLAAGWPSAGSRLGLRRLRAALARSGVELTIDAAGGTLRIGADLAVPLGGPAERTRPRAGGEREGRP